LNHFTAPSAKAISPLSSFSAAMISQDIALATKKPLGMELQQFPMAQLIVSKNEHPDHSVVILSLSLISCQHKFLRK
jgi:hypothetical protein